MLDDEISRAEDRLSVVNIWNAQVLGNSDIQKVAYYYPDEFVKLAEQNINLMREVKELRRHESRWHETRIYLLRLQSELERAERILKHHGIEDKLNWR